MYIDTHCHVLSTDYDDINKILKELGNNICIISGYNDKSNKEVIDMCLKYENVYGMLGFHPDEIDEFSEESFKYIEDNLQNKKIVGIGEIGLDYYRTKDNKEEQKIMFIKLLDLAKKYSKAVTVHSRESYEDTLNILRQYKNQKIALHCYSYDLKMAKELIGYGMKIGVGGVLTFKNSIKLKEIVKEIPIENIVLETDSPYLTPEPFRGETNSPCNIKYVAQKISEIKGISYEDVCKITTKNAIYQFDLPIII